jgi:hypothetical protein
MLNHVALKIFVAGLKTALSIELLKAMPATFMEAHTQALALKRITANSKKQFVSVQAIDAQNHLRKSGL